MGKIVLLRGLPGAGKSTLANEWVKTEPNRIRLSRDDLRAALFNDEGILSQDKENLINKIIRQQATDALQAGFDVLVDATNLRLKYAREWAKLAAKWGASFETWDVYTPLEVCVAQNDRRFFEGGRLVPEDVIRDLAKRFPYPFPEVIPEAVEANLEPYVAPGSGFEDLVIIDLDGTLARHVSRSPYDYTKVGEDEVIEPVANVLERLQATDVVTYIFSGREDSCRGDTTFWLDKHGIKYDQLFMRKTGDKRNDSLIKYELFNEHVRGEFNVIAWIDDRLRVAQMVHDIGLPLLRVGDPSADF